MRIYFFSGLLRLTVISIFAFGVISCSYPLRTAHQMKGEINIRTPQAEKIPLRAGLYMPEEFVTFTYEKLLNLETIIFPLGESLREASIQMVNEVFQDAVVLDAFEDAESQKVDIIISPQVQDVRIEKTSIWPGGNTIFTIVIEWTVLDTESRVIWEESFEGKGISTTGTTFNRGQRHVQRAFLAIEDHFNQALSGILSSKWWESISRDPGGGTLTSN